MIQDSDLATIHAEMVAVQAVLIALARRIAHESPELGRAVCAAFEDAETMMSGVAVRLGIEAPAESTLGALRIIGEMRRAVIRDESLCSEPQGGG